MREIFDGEPPYPIPYEFVQFKSNGKVQQMHKSKGSVVTGLEAINMNPPEVVKYLFLRVNPQKSIDYDYTDGMPIICDEFDRMERLHYSGEYTETEENSVRAYQISKNNVLADKQPAQVPYGHLVNLVQMTEDMDGVFAILKRTGYLDGATDEDLAAIRKRAETAKYWLDHGVADAKYRFSVQKTLPDVPLDADQKAFLAGLADSLSAAEWNGDVIGQVISEAGKVSPIGTKGAFKVLYQILINKERGPRLGNFLASMDRDFVIGRVTEASQ